MPGTLAVAVLSRFEKPKIHTLGKGEKDEGYTSCNVRSA